MVNRVHVRLGTVSVTKSLIIWHGWLIYYWLYINELKNGNRILHNQVLWSVEASAKSFIIVFDPILRWQSVDNEWYCFFSSHSLNTKISNISNLIKSICSCRLFFFFFIQNKLFNTHTHTQLKWNELTVTKCMFTKVWHLKFFKLNECVRCCSATRTHNANIKVV